MNEFYAVLAGIGIGVVIAAPVGPVNVICIHRAATHGFRAGVLSGLGSVVGDGIFAALAAFGVTTVTKFVSGYAPLLHLVGGLLLLAFGLRLLLWPPASPPERKVQPSPSHLGLFGATFVLTITNPATLFGTVALFGGAGAVLRGFDDFGQTWLIVLAVMAGSALWWGILSAVIASWRHMISDRTLRLINAGSGLALVIFGLFVLGRLADNLLLGGIVSGA